MKPVSGTMAALVFILIIAEPARATQCPNWTEEQEELLVKAAYLAAPHDWSYTLAAIVWQESYWGDEVRRSNPNDADGGSWGVTQMRVTTALYIVGWDDTPDTRQIMRELLITCDSCAMELSLHYLMRHIELRGYSAGIARYNGSGERAELYARRVIARVRILEQCAPWHP